jgi:DNA-binding winged helix-turn-helix (wHTH) protein/tetratricopeptide (TPR) repeat protein
MSSNGTGAAMSGSVLRFGPFALDVRTRLLSRDGAPVALGPKVVETLVALTERPGELITKDDLMERLWPNQFVAEGNLTQNVYRLRRVLSEAGMSGAIETLACRGYRFVAPVERVAFTQPAEAPSAAHEQEPLRDAADRTPLPAPDRRAASRRWVSILATACSLLLMAPATSRPLPAFARLSPESQRLYALGRYHYNLRSDPAQVAQSLRYFRAVVKRDPGNPLGYSGLADAYLAVFDADCDAEVRGCAATVALARGNALAAVARDPGSAEAHTSLAMTINELAHDTPRAEAEFRRAIELDDGYALAHHWYGNVLLVSGRPAEATVQHRLALALEPASPATYAWLAHDAFFSRRYGEAVAYARESLAIYPRRHPTRVVLGLAYERLGDRPAALAAFAPLPGPERTALIAAMDARTGRRERALAALRGIRGGEASGTGSMLALAFAWLAVGDRSRAYAFMRATPLPNEVERRFLALDPRLDALRGDPRFRRWTAPG